MKKTNESGFTLIELLVVISIIGLLSTMAVVSLNSAREKARDAKRVSDVKQLVTLLNMAASQNSATALAGCVLADALSTSCTGPSEVAQFANFKDPNGTAACTAASVAPCQYSILNAGATVSSTTIRFFLENGSGALGAGLHTIDQVGVAI